MTYRRLKGGHGADAIRTAGEPLIDLSSIPQPPPFYDDALCAQVDTESFFPEKGGSTKQAKAVCGRCPVEGPCLAYALANEERHGIWGGKSERERRKLAKAARLQAVSL